MDNAFSGINQLLWFIHRTVFELIPAFVADVFIYFFLISQDSISAPAWVNTWNSFFQSDPNPFLKTIIIAGIVILTTLIIKAMASQFYWTNSLAKVNLELYPNYVRFLERINSDFKKDFGDDFFFNPREIQNFIRYKIMEEHKEFNTYLWYKSTEYYATRDLAGAVIFVSIFTLPFACLETEISLVKYLILAVYGGCTFFILGLFLRKKIKEINFIEETDYKKENKAKFIFYARTSKLKFSKIDFCMIAFLAIGMAAFWLSGICAYTFISCLLYIIGVNFLLFTPLYLLFVYVFLEHKSFKKTLMDTFISMRYNNQIFNDHGK